MRAVARLSRNPVKGTERQFIKYYTAYLQGTRELGLAFVQSSELDLTAYRGADYADESNDRRLVSTHATIEVALLFRPRLR